MTAIPTARLREIEAAALMATPGPWFNRDSRRFVISAANDVIVLHDSCINSYNSEYIAAVDPTTVASLVRELVLAREVIATVRTMAEMLTPEGQDDVLDGQVMPALAAYDSAAADQQGRGT
jgi:hypothetical protein